MAILAVPLFFSFSCAGSTPLEPAIPDTLSEQNPETGLTRATEVTRSNNRYLVGIWIVSVNEEQTGAEIIPLRTAGFHMNAVQMLEVSPCTNCLTVTNLSPEPPDKLSLDLGIKHPFAAGVVLTGFDPRAIFISDSDTSFNASGRSVNLGSTYPRLLDPDGYTSLFNEVEFTDPGPEWLRYFDGKFAFGSGFDATLNPYIAYSRTVERRMLLAGSDQTQNITIQKPSGAFQFGYAVDFSWVKPTGTSGDPAIDFPPGANSFEAFEIQVEQTTDLGENPGSTATITVDVFDHQGNNTIDTVSIEVPGVFTGETAGDFVSAVGDEQYQYTIEIENPSGASEGVYPALVRVVDTLEDTMHGPIDAWMVAEVTVTENVTSPPVAIATVQSGPYELDVAINFFNDGSYDPDGGDIVLYEWDWDNDGTYEDTGEAVSHSWSTPGLKEIQFRVTDDEDETDVLDDAIEISIATILPVAIASVADGPYYTNEPINFYDDGSYDPDGGDIALYEWDWDNDGTFDEEGADVFHAWEDAGIQTINFRVTDDDDETDELDEPLVIETEILTLDPIALMEASTSVQNVEQAITFTGLGYDPDGGVIITHEWDWDNDGTYDDEGEVLDHTWTEAGIKLIQYKVTDDEGQWAELTEPAEIEIKEPSGWTVAWGSEYFVAADEAGFSVDVDELGNAYVTGICRPDQIDFDPGPGQENYNDGEDFATYLVKFNSDGEFQWVRVWSYGDLYTSGVFFMNETPLLAYNHDGHVYVTGAFDGTVDFDPGDGVNEFTGYTEFGYFSNYLSKFDTNGNYVWTRVWDTDAPTDIVADENGDAYLTGAFTYSSDFDPGAGTVTLTSNGQHDAFLVKVDTGGNYVWAISWGGSHDDYGISLASDLSGNIVVSGEIFSSADMDPGDGVDVKTTPGSAEGAYITKLNLDGEYQWCTIWGEDWSFGLGPRRLSPVAMSSGGNIYVGGLAGMGTYDFDPGDGVVEHSLGAPLNGFISAFDSSGDFLRVSLFEPTSPSSHYLVPQRLATNSSGNLYVTGLFTGFIDFDPGAGVYELGTLESTYSAHVFSLDSAGSLAWAGWYKSEGEYSVAQNSGIGIVADETGRSYVTGFMYEGMDYDPGPGEIPQSPGSHSWLSMMPPDGIW